MRIFTQPFSFVLALTLSFASQAFAGEDTHAGQAVSNAGQASGHASASAAHSIAASGQVTSAAIAIPLSVGGAVLGSAGAVSAGAARGSANAATSTIGKPLEITDEAIITAPPNEALRNKKEEKSEKKI